MSAARSQGRSVWGADDVEDVQLVIDATPRQMRHEALVPAGRLAAVVAAFIEHGLPEAVEVRGNRVYITLPVAAGATSASIVEQRDNAIDLATRAYEGA